MQIKSLISSYVIILTRKLLNKLSSILHKFKCCNQVVAECSEISVYLILKCVSPRYLCNINSNSKFVSFYYNICVPEAEKKFIYLNE